MFVSRYAWFVLYCLSRSCSTCVLIILGRLRGLIGIHLSQFNVSCGDSLIELYTKRGDTIVLCLIDGEFFLNLAESY